MGGLPGLPPVGLTCAVKGPRHPPVRDCARGPVDDGVRLSLALEVRECARGPVDDGVRVPGTVRAGQCLGVWALLLVVVTPSCAAGPYWWQCGRPAWTTTSGVNLRSEGAQASTCPVDPAIPVANAAAPASIAFASRRG